MRLDRFLSGQTALSRRELGELIRHGAVTVNGTVIRKPDAAVQPETDAVTLRGSPVSYSEFHWFLLHKPEGVITAARDPKQKTVLDLLDPADRLPKLAPVGRLDKDTSGLLLITDDGVTAHRMISPKHHVAKYYLARLRDPFREEYVRKFRDGILLREGDREEACQQRNAVQLHPISPFWSCMKGSIIRCGGCSPLRAIMLKTCSAYRSECCSCLLICPKNAICHFSTKI